MDAAVQGQRGGREEVWPLPGDVKEAIDNYVKLDRRRRDHGRENMEQNAVNFPVYDEE